MITAITPTGDRPETFKLCRKWIFGQTKLPDQWIVVDDGRVPLTDDLKNDLEYIRREPQAREGHTLLLNLHLALPYIKGSKILIIEDDDWYGPDYIHTMSKLLDTYDLVGEMKARYYNVPAMKCKRIGNGAHASLCQTGFTKKILSVFESCLIMDSYVDDRLWKVPGVKSFLINDEDDSLRLHCSLKGLKGRKGIGTGHNMNARYYRPDVGLEHLIKWVGEENARIYMEHVGRNFEIAKLYYAGRRV